MGHACGPSAGFQTVPVVRPIAFSCIRSTRDFQHADSNAVTRPVRGVDAGSRNRSEALGQPRFEGRATMIAEKLWIRFASARAVQEQAARIGNKLRGRSSLRCESQTP